MRYMRIEESAMDHPKFIAIDANAWRLWCEGGSYCQRHLTDGFVPSTALRGFRYFSQKALRQLCEALAPGKGPLWEKVEGGIRVHDYLEWNEPRDKVLKARQDAKTRLERWRAGRGTPGTEQSTEQRVTSRSETHITTPRDTVAKRTGTERTNSPERDPGSVPRARLAFGGRVLEVPKFLDEEFVRRLNGQVFDLSAFYVALDEQLGQSGEPWDLRWIRDAFAAASPGPARRAAAEERPISGDERQRAERHRRAVGGCKHDPRCGTAAGCVALIIRTWRELEADALRAS